MANIVSSRTDIETYVADAHADLGSELGALLVAEIQAADHPAYGRDWSEWLDANIAELRNGTLES